MIHPTRMHVPVKERILGSGWDPRPRLVASSDRSLRISTVLVEVVASQGFGEPHKGIVRHSKSHGPRLLASRYWPPSFLAAEFRHSEPIMRILSPFYV